MPEPEPEPEPEPVPVPVPVPEPVPELPPPGGASVAPSSWRSAPRNRIMAIVLKGSRDAVLQKIQPISIHGQLSYDVHYLFADEPDGQVRVARIGPEAVAPGLQPGDRIRLDFMVGVVTAIHRDAPGGG